MADDITTGGSMVANMRYVIKKILTDNPYCKIFVITPINCRSYGTYDTNWGINYKGGTGGHLNSLGLQDIFDRMKEVCDYHGIELIDMTHSSVVNRENIKTALADYIHPTVECHAAMARELAKKINFQ
jgi:lysophospholipase L1-like esterase